MVLYLNSNCSSLINYIIHSEGKFKCRYVCFETCSNPLEVGMHNIIAPDKFFGCCLFCEHIIFVVKSKVSAFCKEGSYNYGYRNFGKMMYFSNYCEFKETVLNERLVNSEPQLKKKKGHKYRYKIWVKKPFFFVCLSMSRYEFILMHLK